MITFFQLLGLCTAKMALTVARVAMKVARAAWGNGMDPGPRDMDLLARTAYMTGFSGRLIVTKLALGVAEMTSDFAGWLLRENPDDDSRGPSADGR
jgi:hypothetical protein